MFLLMFLLVSGQPIQMIVIGGGIVRAPGAGDAGGLLDGDALPTLGEEALDARLCIGIGLGVCAEEGGVGLADALVLRRQSVEGRDLGMVGVTEADVGDRTSDAHNSVTSRATRIAPCVRI